jgi:hypothetical protein
MHRVPNGLFRILRSAIAPATAPRRIALRQLDGWRYRLWMTFWLLVAILGPMLWIESIS